MTWRKKKSGILKIQPMLTTVSSKTTSINPRVMRKRATDALSRSALSLMKTAVPARKTKTGAQKWVTHRVAK